MTIAGTDVLSYLKQESLEIDYVINGRPVLRSELNVRDGDSYRPAVNADIVVTDDGTRVFGGVLYNMVETDVVDYRHRRVTIDGTGYALYADRTLLNGIISAGTLKSMLTTVVTNIAHGISVDSGQVNGPTLVAQGFPFKTCMECLNQLEVVSGYVTKFDFNKKVSMFAPGSVGAPFALDDTNSTILSLELTKNLDNYANIVWVQFGGTTQQQVTVTLHGDSSTRLFPLGYTAAVAPTTVTVNGVVKTVGIYGVDTHPPYDYFYREVDPTYPYSIIQDASQTVLNPGDSLVVTFTAQFPGALYVLDAGEVAANGNFVIIIQAPDVYDRDVATAIAQGELNRRVGIVRTIRARTLTAGLEPGMSINITASKRGLSSVACLITSVKMTHLLKRRDGTHMFAYDIEAVEGNQYQSNWLDYFKGLQQNGGGSSGATASSGGVVTSPSVVPYAYWGGSLKDGQIANATWVDVIDAIPVRLDGTSGQPTTVRALQRTSNAGTSVQTRIVKRVSGVDTSMATSATSTSTTTDQELITFTPNTGVNDYYLQVKGGNGNAQIFAMGQSL